MEHPKTDSLKEFADKFLWYNENMNLTAEKGSMRDALLKTYWAEMIRISQEALK